MKTLTKLTGTLLVLMSICSSAFANVVPWDRMLAYPVPMTAEQIALADEELLPENVNKTKVAYASDHGQKFEEKSDEEPAPYFEITSTTKRGKDSADSFGGIGFYAEFPINKEGLSLWLSGYKDPGFRAGYIGLAKKFGNWQWAIGGADATYGGKRHFVTNPWVYYSSEELDAYLHAEHYSRDSENPWWYKGYVEKKFGNIGLGLYGEKGMGVGPRLSFKLNNHVKVWATVPMWSQPETGRMKFFINVVFSF